MQIDEVGSVANGFDFGLCGMAQLATERRVDASVTHQAVSHLRVVGWSRGIALCQTTMASQAGILGLELVSNRSCRRKISSAVDRCGQSRGNISQRQMLLMAKFQSSRWTLEDIGFLSLVIFHRVQAVMASKAGLGLGQVIVSCEPARKRAVVAIFATDAFQRQVLAM